MDGVPETLAHLHYWSAQLTRECEYEAKTLRASCIRAPGTVGAGAPAVAPKPDPAARSSEDKPHAPPGPAAR